MKNKMKLIVVAAVSIALLILIAVWPESLGGLNFQMKLIAISLVFPILLGVATAKIYRAWASKPATPETK